MPKCSPGGAANRGDQGADGHAHGFSKLCLLPFLNHTSISLILFPVSCFFPICKFFYENSMVHPPSLESKSMFSVTCFQYWFYNSCFPLSLPWFSTIFAMHHVLFWKVLLKFTNPCLQLHKSHKYPDFPFARYFHSHKKSKVWWFTTCLSILSVLLVPYLH